MMSRDPANDARLAREEARRQQFFREDGARRLAESRREAKKAEEWREHIGRMNAEDARAKRHAPSYNYSTPTSRTSYNDLPASLAPHTGDAGPHDYKNFEVGRRASFGAALGRSIGGAIKTLFILSALYGARDNVINQSPIAESAVNTGLIVYGLSNALGGKIRSIDQNSFLITVTDDFRWVVGLVASIDVGVGAGTGNAVVLVIREGAHLIQSMRTPGAS
jgi:hypothetical protein